MGSAKRVGWKQSTRFRFRLCADLSEKGRCLKNSTRIRKLKCKQSGFDHRLHEIRQSSGILWLCQNGETLDAHQRIDPGM
jgi:hypothetical protein